MKRLLVMLILESQGRRALGSAELQAIRHLPGENYLVDLESATLDVIVHYKYAEHWTCYLIASESNVIKGA